MLVVVYDASQSLHYRSENKLREVLDKVQALNNQYDGSVEMKENLRKQQEDLENKLARAEELVSGLSGERTRWEASILNFNKQIKNLVGDCAIAAAFLSYCGPFTSGYRQKLVKNRWMVAVKANQLPFSQDFTPANFLASPTEVRQWNLKGLPTDNFSTENGVLVTKAKRWPLVVDPQNQVRTGILVLGRTCAQKTC